MNKGIEELKAIYFAPDALVTQPRKVYRIHSDGLRYYYTIDQDGEARFFPSVTTILHMTMPKAPQLVQWIADRGYDEAMQEAEKRADYGTIMHGLCADLAIQRKFDLATVKDQALQYLRKNGRPEAWASDWESDLKSDVLAFAMWLIDYNVEIMAIEITLASDTLGYGATLDIVCNLDIEVKGYFGEVYKSGDKKGLPKESKQVYRKRAIVDMKSGRKGFYEDHALQLQAYKKLWDENNPAQPIDMLANWSPKEWRSAPSYNFKDQTDAKNAAKKWDLLLAIAKLEIEGRDKTITTYDGTIDLTQGLDQNITVLPLSEYVKVKQDNKDTQDK